MINGLVCKPALQEVQVFKKRWLMLLLFVICSTCNAAHWVQFSIISNIVTRYYGVSSLAIDWTSMVYMAAYIPLVLPAAWLLDKKGLRLTLICGAIFMTAGSWIKVASVSPDRFYVAFIGQIFVGAAQIFILGVPARLAAVWFGPTQVSTATSIGVFGNQVGIALSFLLPPVIVGNHDSLEDIGKDLMKLYKAPPVPPSTAQASIKCQEDKSTYVKSLKALASNKNFLLLLASYGINVGVFYAVSTLLNQVLLLHFKNHLIINKDTLVNFENHLNINKDTLVNFENHLNINKDTLVNFENHLNINKDTLDYYNINKDTLVCCKDYYNINKDTLVYSNI
uniref:Feline leukemia virus subgroup C receptor-related protein 2 n=1 Tax=Timema monikensis TaxID=170555 RepID=A0A7R9EEB5_9NEOP|nr:unnamed protein product [Timema monikensis]